MIINIIKGLIKIASCVYYKLFENTTDFSEDSNVTLLGKLFVPLVIVYVVYASKSNRRRKSRSNISFDTDTEMTDLDEMEENNNISGESNIFGSHISMESQLQGNPAFESETTAGTRSIFKRSRTPFSMVGSSLRGQTANNLCNMRNTTETLLSTGSDSDFQPLPRLDTFHIRESRLATVASANNLAENNSEVPGSSANNILSTPIIHTEPKSNRIPQRRRYASSNRNTSPVLLRKRKKN